MPWIDKDTYELPRWIGVPIGWTIILAGFAAFVAVFALTVRALIGILFG